MFETHSCSKFHCFHSDPQSFAVAGVTYDVSILLSYKPRSQFRRSDLRLTLCNNKNCDCLRRFHFLISRQVAPVIELTTRHLALERVFNCMKLCAGPVLTAGINTASILVRFVLILSERHHVKHNYTSHPFYHIL